MQSIQDLLARAAFLHLIGCDREAKELYGLVNAIYRKAELIRKGKSQ